MLNLIAISGKANTGKDHVAKLICSTYQYFPFSFALHFKMEMVGMGDVTYEEVMHTKPPHVRHMIQERGTEYGRMLYGDDLWVDTIHAWFTYFSSEWGTNKFIIPDIRFPNEAEYVKKMGGKIFRVTSDRIINTALTQEQQKHISETALDDYESSFFDGIISNNLDTTNADLMQQINTLIR